MAPLLLPNANRPLSWSLIALWIACIIFILVVVFLGITLLQRVDTLAQRVDSIGTEQARRTGVITEMQALRDELARMRALQLEKVIVIEATKNQVLTNVLTLSRLEKKLDLVEAQLQELKYPKRSGEEPSSLTPRE